MQLEEEAAEVTSLDATDRSDEVELLVEEFGAMDASLRKLVSTPHHRRVASELISDEDLTELATDIPDLKSRLGIADDGMGTLSPEVLGERISRTATESAEKAREGAEFMARSVKMLGGDISASASTAVRGDRGSTLRAITTKPGFERTALDIFTFVPFIIILIVPLTPVGHVLIFSFIQRYFPALFPSQFSGRRQELMKKYEELSRPLRRRLSTRTDQEGGRRALRGGDGGGEPHDGRRVGRRGGQGGGCGDGDGERRQPNKLLLQAQGTRANGALRRSRAWCGKSPLKQMK